jgi:Na+-transporting NADH:ubiquinone oxidoreductase subunit A
MITHKITKGIDLRIAGPAEAIFADAPEPAIVAVRPDDFPGIKPKLRVQEGDAVRTGDPLFVDKNRPDCVFVSPATGVVSKVDLGPRRKLLGVEIAVDRNEVFGPIPHVPADRLGSTPREELCRALLGAGLWPLIRQRPVGKIADPDVEPVAIFVNGMDTEPLAADPAFAVQGRGEDLQAGIDVLRALSSGPVYLTVRAGASLPKEFQALHGVEIHAFDGPHPSGLVGTHLQAIRPLKMGERVFYLKAQEAVLLGQWVRSGHYPAQRVVAVAGERAKQRRYFRVRQGARLDALLGGAPAAGDRVIQGTVLTGPAGRAFLGFYAQTVTVIHEGAEDRDLFGWGLPQPSRLSIFKAVWPFGRGVPVSVDARLNGGHRPPVNLGAWERVIAGDVLPTFLLRAIQANDLDEALKLGLLELTEEDVALCTVVDPCKNDVGKIVRQGLDLYERES